MKICMISGSCSPMKCGVAEYTYRLSEHLADKGNTVDIITTANWKIMITDYFHTGVRVLPVVKEWDLSALPGILKYVKDTDPDIINIQYALSLYKNPLLIYFLALMLKHRYRKKSVIVTVHEIGGPWPFWSFIESMKSVDDFGKIKQVFVPRSELIFKLITNFRRTTTFEALGFTNRNEFEASFHDLDIAQKMLLAESDAIIVTNAEHEAYIRDHYPESSEKVEIVPLGVSIKVGRNPSTEARDRIRQRIGVSVDSMLISFFGYILPGKGLETLLMALKQLIASGIKTHVVAIGGINDIVGSQKYVDELKKLAEELEVNGYTFWTGFGSDEEISRYLFSSDICVLPYDEGVSFRRQTFITALAHGLPIITTMGNQVSGDIVHRENAYLVPPKDSILLAEAIKTLSGSKELRERLAQGARKLVGAFSWDSIIEKTLETYRTAMDKSK